MRGSDRSRRSEQGRGGRDCRWRHGVGEGVRRVDRQIGKIHSRKLRCFFGQATLMGLRLCGVMQQCMSKDAVGNVRGRLRGRWGVGVSSDEDEDEDEGDDGMGAV